MPVQNTQLPVRIRPILAAGAVLGLGTVATFASFTDNDTASTMFSTGTVNLALSAPGSDVRNWTKLGMENAKPGDVTYAPLVVSNIGTLDFTYDMVTTTVGDDPLADALQATIVAGAATCDASAFGAAVLPIASGKLSTISLAGRTLSAKTSTVTDTDTLCFRIELPTTSADNDLQDLGLNTYFSFTATQAA